MESVRDDPAQAEAPSAVVGGTRQARERVKQLAQVQKAREVLGAEILYVDPEFGEVAATVLPDDGAAESPDEE